MAVTLTDEQLKNISKDIILLPFLINDPLSGYISQKAYLQSTLIGLLEADNNAAVFYNFLKNDVILKYQYELAELTGVARSNYLDSFLNDGGNQTGVHYPDTPINVTLAPLIIPEMSGNPTTVVNYGEPYGITNVSLYVNYIKNGFNDGVDTFQADNITSTVFDFISGTIPDIGDRFVIVSGPDSFMGIVESIDSNAVTYTFIGGTLVSSGNGATYMAGFTDAERSHSSTPVYNSIMLFFESEILNYVNEWKTSLNNQIAHLTNNLDYEPRATENAAASANCSFTDDLLDSWFALSYNSKYTNSGLALLEGEITSRQPEITARVATINTNLGSVSQSITGEFSGSGLYYSFAVNLNIRIARTGTLCSYISSEALLAYFDKKINDTLLQIAHYEMFMIARQIAADVEPLSLTVEVLDVTNLNLGDTVKVFDNDSNIYVRVIQGIAGNFVTLNSAIPVLLEAGKLARIVKEL